MCASLEIQETMAIQQVFKVRKGKAIKTFFFLKQKIASMYEKSPPFVKEDVSLATLRQTLMS